ncbi:MAG: hypothetical protein QM756_32090 [Polyangiaceae bacterium]
MNPRRVSCRGLVLCFGVLCLQCSGSSDDAANSGGAASGGAATSNGGTSTSSGGASSNGGAATTGGAGAGGAVALSAFAQVAKVFSQHCTGCHGSTQSVRIVLADDDGLYGRLTTPLPATSCVGVTPVDVTSPMSSLLYNIVAGPIDFSAQSPLCKLNQMPNGCFFDSCLPAAKISTIQDWISAGAPKE